MKGQFIAVEAVLSLGIGLIVAIGLLTAFTAFQSGVMNDVEESQINTVQSEIGTALISLSQPSVSSARKSLVLPDTIGDRSYQLDLDNGSLYVLVGGERYVTRFESLNATYSFQGSASGGEVSVLKEDNKLIISDD
ncbi:MAG: hypothetical protein ABEK00_03260 [Candidatus Nanohaloarchaea archaeon]